MCEKVGFEGGFHQEPVGPHSVSAVVVWPVVLAGEVVVRVLVGILQFDELGCVLRNVQ